MTYKPFLSECIVWALPEDSVIIARCQRNTENKKSCDGDRKVEGYFRTYKQPQRMNCGRLWWTMDTGRDDGGCGER